MKKLKEHKGLKLAGIITIIGVLANVTQIIDFSMKLFDRTNVPVSPEPEIAEVSDEMCSYPPIDLEEVPIQEITIVSADVCNYPPIALKEVPAQEVAVVSADVCSPPPEIAEVSDDACSYPPIELKEVPVS